LVALQLVRELLLVVVVTAAMVACVAARVETFAVMLHQHACTDTFA
jgi:hypothetical protein